MYILFDETHSNGRAHQEYLQSCPSKFREINYSYSKLCNSCFPMS